MLHTPHGGEGTMTRDEILNGDKKVLFDELQKVRAERDSWRARCEKYGRHKKGCNVLNGSGRGCSCGFSNPTHFRPSRRPGTADRERHRDGPPMTPTPKVKETQEPRIYPCMKCGKMRTKSEGGTVFTVCDKCWKKS